MFRLVLISTFATLACARAPYVGFSKPTLDGRIVGGEDTTIEEHPYQVSFQYYEQHMCGGSLIAPNVVVTAAHCTNGTELEELTVRAGSTYHEKSGVVLQVKSFHDHPKYDESDKDIDYDVSVLILDGSFKLSQSIRLIPLSAVDFEVPNGHLAKVSGWGFTEEDSKLPEILQAVDVPKVKQDTCKKNYPRDNITDRMHCFGYIKGKKDACEGDSGGPLVYNGTLVGVVSWARGCGRPNRPGVYIKVANKEINDFIHGVLQSYA